jgi:hypothetical protein
MQQEQTGSESSGTAAGAGAGAAQLGQNQQAVDYYETSWNQGFYLILGCCRRAPAALAGRARKQGRAKESCIVLKGVSPDRCAMSQRMPSLGQPRENPRSTISMQYNLEYTGMGNVNTRNGRRWPTSIEILIIKQAVCREAPRFCRGSEVAPHAGLCCQGLCHRRQPCTHSTFAAKEMPQFAKGAASQSRTGGSSGSAARPLCQRRGRLCSGGQVD